MGMMGERRGEKRGMMGVTGKIASLSRLFPPQVMNKTVTDENGEHSYTGQCPIYSTTCLKKSIPV